MRLSEVADGLRAGAISLDLCGHQVRATPEILVERIQEYVQLAAGSRDGQWPCVRKNEQLAGQFDADMRAHFQAKLDRSVALGGTIDEEAWVGTGATCCRGCGKVLLWELTEDGTTLRLNTTRHFTDKPFRAVHTSWGRRSCEWPQTRITTDRIQVRDGLVFANYFGFDDAPKDQEGSEKYDLNSRYGQSNIMRFKAPERNVAYGQTTNTSLTVYRNQSSDTVVLVQRCDRTMSKTGRFEQIGRIDCDVWRWEATDRMTLAGPRDKHEDKVAHDAENKITLPEAVPGTWRFWNVFDRGGKVAAILKRVGDLK